MARRSAEHVSPKHAGACGGRRASSHCLPRLSHSTIHVFRFSFRDVTMEYSVIFDVAQSGYRQWWFPAIGLIPIAVGIVFVIYRRRRWPTFLPFWFGFAILWTSVTFVGTFSDYRSLA